MLSPEHGAAVVRSGWWRSFGSAELDKLMARGLFGSDTLQEAAARIRQAEGTAEVEAAPLAPSLALTATQDQASGASNAQTHQALLQASYEIDFWGKNRAAAASGAALVRASAFDVDTVAMTLSASVADTYFRFYRCESESDSHSRSPVMRGVSLA